MRGGVGDIPITAFFEAWKKPRPYQTHFAFIEPKDRNARPWRSMDHWAHGPSEAVRPFATGSDYVNQIGLEKDEGSERFKAAYGVNTTGLWR
jgi:hypothetical protein